ncbi:MAG: class I SAM-dependent methyltransferase [Bacteroidales bacterium]
MKYDPVKRSLGNFFNRSPFLRILFYKLLDLLLLRSWHIRRELKQLEKGGLNTEQKGGLVPEQKGGLDPEHIADAGSGFGQYVYYLSQKFPRAKITGLDIKKEQIEDCNRFFKTIHLDDRVVFEYSDLTLLDRDNEFDLILSVDVMEHIEDDRTVFLNLHRALRPEGVLLISTPSDQGGSDVHHEEDESFIDEHVRDGYGMDEIVEKLRQAGFSEIHARYSYGRPGKISWKLSMKYPILMVNISKLFLILLPFYYLITFPVSYFLNRADVRRSHETGTGLIVKCRK